MDLAVIIRDNMLGNSHRNDRQLMTTMVIIENSMWHAACLIGDLKIGRSPRNILDLSVLWISSFSSLSLSLSLSLSRSLSLSLSLSLVIDPTVRFETNADVDAIVREEKSSIYESCIPDLKLRYGHEDFEYEVIGIWFGARGAIGESVLKLFDRFGLPKCKISEIAVGVIADSVKIIHHHIYAS